jgi:hypothetical protein
LQSATTPFEERAFVRADAVQIHLDHFKFGAKVALSTIGQDWRWLAIRLEKHEV